MAPQQAATPVGETHRKRGNGDTREDCAREGCAGAAEQQTLQTWPTTVGRAGQPHLQAHVAVLNGDALVHAGQRRTPQGGRRQQHSDGVGLEDDDLLTIVFAEVVPVQVLDTVAPGAAPHPLPLQGWTGGGRVDPDQVIAGVAAHPV
jgi:hypothetical protein